MSTSAPSDIFELMIPLETTNRHRNIRIYRSRRYVVVIDAGAGIRDS
jgi:hypothetical protein